MYTDKEYIAKKLEEIKKSGMTYHGRKLTNEVIAEIADTQPSSVSYWCNAKKLMSYKYREAITQALGLDAHYFDLEYSPEYIRDKEEQEDINFFLESVNYYMDLTGVGIPQDVHNDLKATYHFMKTLGFQEVIDRYKKEGKGIELASLLLTWRNVFVRLFPLLEDFLEDYSSDAQIIVDAHRNGNSISFPNEEEAEKEMQELENLAKEYRFFLTGDFDNCRNIIFNLYDNHRKSAPMERDNKEV